MNCHFLDNKCWDRCEILGVIKDKTGDVVRSTSLCQKWGDRPQIVGIKHVEP